jgi:hypothetical protein
MSPTFTTADPSACLANLPVSMVIEVPSGNENVFCLNDGSIILLNQNLKKKGTLKKPP